MPEALTEQQVTSKTDPSVANQYDNNTSKETQVEGFYSFVDGAQIGLLTTQRPKVGLVSRSMAIGKRVGPDVSDGTHSPLHTRQDPL